MSDLARAMWTRFEPVHAVAYFAPGPRAAFESAGVRGFWRSYFAGRAAPLGRTGPGPVHAAFQGFTREAVERAVPSVWDLIEPADAWRIRTEACGVAVAVCCQDDRNGELTAVADVLRRVASALDPVGRPFFAAHLDLAWPDDPHAAIWHACTLLREHRGDGYVAACLVHDVSGLDMMLLAERSGTVPDGHAAVNRGWSPAAVHAARQSLRARGLLDAEDTPTQAAAALKDAVESATDRLAGPAWHDLDDDDLRTARNGLDRIVEEIVGRGWITYPNPVGVDRPG